MPLHLTTITMRQLKITKSITNRESASLEKYLQEIGQEDLLTVEEERLHGEPDYTVDEVASMMEQAIREVRHAGA